MLRRIRIIHFSAWADRLEEADVFLKRLPALDLVPRVTNPADVELMRMARLDCDWHGENTRAFAAMSDPAIEFLPSRVTGTAGLAELTKINRASDEESWLIFDGQSPQKLAGVFGRLMPMLGRAGIRTAWYAFDESSRTISAFKEIAPYLDIFIHDELPLDPANHGLLRRDCIIIHRSWVANVVPFALPFNETPEERILFLGSKLGLTDHRKRQIKFLGKNFGDRFVAVHDHSISVADRATLNRFKVSLCPEGRKFGTPAMSMTHTDRPFWSGCLGLVPLSENSQTGDRLNSLAEQQLIRRYSHGNLPELKAVCEAALNTSVNERRRIYEHFNRNETVGMVMTAALSAAESHVGPHF